MAPKQTAVRCLCSKCRPEVCLTHIHVPRLSTLPSLVQRSLKHYFINESGFSETTFYSPNQHDLQIQFTFFVLSMQYVVSWSCVCYGLKIMSGFKLLQMTVYTEHVLHII